MSWIDVHLQFTSPCFVTHRYHCSEAHPRSFDVGETTLVAVNAIGLLGIVEKTKLEMGGAKWGW